MGLGRQWDISGRLRSADQEQVGTGGDVTVPHVAADDDEAIFAPTMKRELHDRHGKLSLANGWHVRHPKHDRRSRRSERAVLALPLSRQF